MKRTILIIVIAFTTLTLYSQFKKGESFLNVNGMYSKSTSETGVFSNATSIEGKYLNAGMSLTAVISNCLLIGAGLDYNNQHEIRNSSLSIPDKYLVAEEMNVKSNVLVPNIYIGYYYGITTDLFFNTNLKVRFGENNTNVNGQQALMSGSNASPGGYDFPALNTSYRYQTKADYFSTSILPELTYFITTKIGLSLNVGNIEYALTGWDTKNSTFVLNFNPNNWQLGIRMQF